MRHAQLLGRLIQAEILETSLILIGATVLATCLGPFELRLTSLLVLAVILLLEATLSWRIRRYFEPVDPGTLARDRFAMLHLILCSRAGAILSRKSPRSTLPLELLRYVEVTMVERRRQSANSDVSANTSLDEGTASLAQYEAVSSTETHGRDSTAQQSSLLAPQFQFEVIAKTLLEIHDNDDPEYGPHFRSAAMPYTNAAVFCLTLAHGFFWCLSTTLVPCYSYHKNILGAITFVNALLKTIVSPTALPWLAGILVLADGFTDYLGFRHWDNFDPRFRLFRDLPQVLSAIGIFGAIFDAMEI